jgi:hypothetical protein
LTRLLRSGVVVYQERPVRATVSEDVARREHPPAWFEKRREKDEDDEDRQGRHSHESINKGPAWLVGVHAAAARSTLPRIYT